MKNLFKLVALTGLLTLIPSLPRAENLFPRPFQYAGTRSSGYPLVSYPGAVPPGTYPPTNALDNNAIASYARYPLVSIDLQPTFNRRPDILNAIKAANPNCKVLVYVLAGHWYTPASDDPNVDLMNKIHSQLVAYDNATGGKAFLYGTDGAKWLDNFSVNLGDRNVITALEGVWMQVLSNPKVDGLMIDCLNYDIGWTSPYNDGVNPVRILDHVRAGYATKAQMDAAFSSEAALLMIRLRASYPNKIIIGNSNQQQTSYQAVSGRMWEGWPGQNPGEYPATWTGIHNANIADGASYNVYKSEHFASTSQYAELATSSVYSWQTTAKVRYILGSACMGEGWGTYAFNRDIPTYGSGPNTGKYVVPSPSLWWFDEYSVAVTPGTSYSYADTTGANVFWLGKAMGPATLLANGIWERKFEKGIVVVNPTGSLQTYISSAPMKRIRGVRDTIVNDGSIASSFPLVYQSALFLLYAGEKNATGITDIKVRKNLTSASVSAWVTGDYDTTATLQIFYSRFGSATTDSGMVMIPRRGSRWNAALTTATNYEGRILNVANGRKYQFKLRLTEQLDSGAIQTIESSVYTFTINRPGPIEVGGEVIVPASPPYEEEDNPEGGGLDTPVAPAAGFSYYVRQNGGSDSNDGTSWATAFKTIGAATLAAQVSSPNANILIYPGHYHESINLDWPSNPVNQPRYLVGVAQSADSVIICGANPLYETGYVAPYTRFNWESIGNGIYRTWFPDNAAYSFVIGGERLVRKISPTELHSTQYGVNGWYRTADSLYVRLNNRTSPTGKKLYFGNKAYGVNVATRNWRVSNLRIQYQGYDATPSGAGADIGYDGWGVSVGISGTGSGTVIDNCRIIGTGAHPIYAARGNNGEYRCDSLTVMNNYIDAMWTGSYTAGKNRDGEDVTVFINGEAPVVTGNTFRRMFNGVSPTDNSIVNPDSTLGSWSEVSYNTFKLITDDAIEMDGYQPINRLVYHNTIDSCGRAISLAPVTINGPVMVFYNLITNNEAGFKLGGASYAQTFLAHNTVVGKKPIYNPGDIVRNVTANNNIFWGRKTDYVHQLSAGSTLDYAFSSFNYNLYDSTLVTAMVRYGNILNLSVAAVRVYLPEFETNGKVTLSGIQSVDRNDYRLRFPSNAIDTGRRLPGINTGDRGNRYFNKPDMGRYEFVPPLK